MRRPQFVRSIAAAGAASAIGPLTRIPAQAQSNAPIVLGAALSMTGIYADGGKYCLEGYSLAIKHINAKGGVLGRQLALKYYDDQSEPATGARLYERLIDEDKVDVIIGPYGTAITVPAANVAERHKMPMICPEIADVVLFSRGLRYIFQSVGPVQSYLFGVLSIAHDRGFKRLAIISPNIAFGHSLTDAVPTIARGFGQAIVFQEYYPPNTSDYAPLIEKVRAAGPDVVLAMSFPVDSVGVLRALKQADYAPKMFYEAIGASDPLFTKNVGSDAEGTYSVSCWNFASNSAENIAFVRDYRAEYHRDPDYHAATNYSTVYVLGAALKKVGSLDQEKLRDTLATIQVPTLIGLYKVDPRTGIQLGYTSYIIQWQHGKQVVVYPGNVANAQPMIPFPAWAARRA
ncbi:MAG TPA: amino acid ABC transporter substrate-binding protein [Candidatus Binatia bacterium]|nr:amino acid ABC transporter substrate-binding protein [Candidatus Binatia bacterium]